MHRTFIIIMLVVLVGNFQLVEASTNKNTFIAPQIECSDGSTREISLETKKGFTTRKTKLQILSRKAERYYQLISRREKDILTSTQRCAAGITTECTAADLKTIELDYVVGLREKIRKEFVTTQAEMAAKKNELCTATVPAITIISQ